MGPAIVWFRRDLRTGDLPTLSAVAGDEVLGLFVLDEALLRPSGAPRRDFLYACLAALDEELGGRLCVVRGDPRVVVPQVARDIGAGAVHVSADFGPYGRARDDAVAREVDLVRTGSPYAVAPGRVTKADGAPYRVFTPYFGRWLDHGWRAPADTSARTASWLDPGLSIRVPIPRTGPASRERAGERAALARWAEFLDDDLAGYETGRDRPDLDCTSRMSVYLKYGCIHPRTMLADLAGRSGTGPVAFRRQLAWRDFYADVLHHRPDTARRDYDPRFGALRYDSGPDAESAWSAWCEGRTGYPIVDAGMRQLLAEGWMHNRVRMIVASFLVKDLHLPWWRGARYFMRHLVDGDLASNQHGWQWTAGSGTDAAPYFRVFNPISQGQKFDPDGDYVRRWVPELRGIAGARVHTLADGRPHGYPDPIVDHGIERREALARYGELKRG
ncbi:deoxyribodipyrimidine photo-lyase [Rhodococcus maanshanensis]|uniref:cryptochrome/photolyase family protein n=1 Tax=Rhodococcus maanshanensis TaxID=183556 RepID=UPI0022B44504|nr:deoxyribodipyrimidine photo-lyase [Rhodococcus maanshanensis]MCZ4556198.1 deoxyribodipyrimidine photo-lyase [Rhodococcus maanshanensis]